MDHIRRTERLAAMTQMLMKSPNKSLALSTFCETFDTAKSTASEDLDIIRTAMKRFRFGTLETLPGAAGGVRFRPLIAHEDGLAAVTELCGRMSAPGRVLPGELLYIADLVGDPETLLRMGEIVAGEYYGDEPDFVLTMEMQGIPLAMMTARALGVPVVIARRSVKAYEGAAVHITYPVGSSFKTMSLPKRLVREGQKTIIVDDVLRTGGTLAGMRSLMDEFNVTVAGTAVLIATEQAQRDNPGVRPLMVMEGVDEATGAAKLRPGDWLRE
ncbi:MAG: phosphoribosyltransferase family protein [Clostridiales bacterium]|nr:phosphoribosyltransferase family protein [Clostridiales bacterium]MDY2834883.1 phosphoribosyltransferase family protein [Candidatus Aphodomonas sp.]